MSKLSDLKIILASGSPRRKELLEQVGIAFEVITSDCDESTKETIPSKLVEVLANKKSRAVFEYCVKNNKFESNNCESIVFIGADTIVALDNEILGKPKNEKDALNMLMKLSGRTHQVYTGVSFQILKDNKVFEKYFHEKTDVKMYEFTKEDALEYIATGEPLDKAGSYGIQGRGAVLVKKIKGDYNTVVGLPIAKVYRELVKIAKKIYKS